MSGINKYINLTIWSTFSLIVVYVILLAFQWAIMLLGAWISGLEGQIIFEMISPIASAESWTQQQVLWIYLAPYIGLICLYLLLRWQRRYPIGILAWIQLVQSWTYLLILLFVFFMPLVDIINKQGLYHALNWLHISRSIQFVFGISMWIIFIYKAFHVAALFSTSLQLPSEINTKPKQILSKLPFLWYLPVAFLAILIYLLSNFTLQANSLYFLSGTFSLLLLNTWLIQRYNVIVS